MTKADIVERIHQKIGFSKKESAEMVETVFGLLKLTLESGEKIKIAGVWHDHQNTFFNIGMYCSCNFPPQ